MRHRVFAALLFVQFLGSAIAATDRGLETECEQAAAVEAAVKMSPLTYPSWVRRAELGERFAQLVVGLANTSVRFHLGESADAAQGRKWLEEAAKGGSHYAMTQLSDSVYWTRVGAESGYPLLQGRYASRLARGQDVAKDLKAAIYWYTVAANQGSHISQRWLSIAYDQGLGVQRDPKSALKWALLAARPVQGAVMTRSGSEKSPQTLRAELSHEDIAAAERDVSDWTARHEENERRKAEANEKECGRREIFSNKGFW